MRLKNSLRRCGLCLFAVAATVLSGLAARATNVSFAWDPSPSPNVGGYMLYYGTSGSNYSSTVDAGNATNFTVSGLSPNSTYYFSVLAYSTNNVDSDFANQVVYSLPSLPVITAPPYSMSESVGAVGTFYTTVNAQGPWGAQWYFNGNLLPGATNTSLHFASISDANAGSYNLLVYNAAGSVTSPTAQLIVIDIPVISSQPVSQAVNAGASPSFSVNVAGSGPFTFQWYFNGKAISAANKATLHLTSVTSANSGSYYVVISGAGGSVTSSSATLTVGNAYASLAGSYNGLFYQTNGTETPNVQLASAGMLQNCNVKTNGSYNAQLLMQGYYYPFSGTLNASGQDVEIINRASNNLPNISVSLQIDLSGATKSITGVVSNMSATNVWTSPLLADLATNALPVNNGVITMIIPPVAGSPNSPTTSSRATITVSGGQATVSGQLADTMPLQQTVPIARDGTVPLHFSLYSGAGLMEGWVNIANGQANGMLSWVRPAGVPTAIQFPAGFTNVITIGSGINIQQ